MAWSYDFLALEDGVRLRWGRWPVEGARGHVLLLPGRAEFIEKYDLLAQCWAERGWEAVCLDWRGQGGSTRCLPHDPQKGHIDSFKTYVSDLDVFWNKVWLPLLGKVQTGAKPESGVGEAKQDILVAHSTGAHVLLRFLGETESGRAVTSPVIVSAPLVRLAFTHSVPECLIRAAVSSLAWLWPCAYAWNQRAFDPSRERFDGNPLTQDESRFVAWRELRQRRPELTLGGATWGWVRAAMRSERPLLAALPRVQAPVLALLTPDDRVVDGAPQEALPRLLSRCTTVRLHGARHEVFEESTSIRRVVWEAVDSFLANGTQSRYG